eukprot:GFUD01011930.1.p1 GENE.GFUD01011930.1~~GFUD01011930.1.p1  ORF type:complete len:285 (+),score=107.75 GFUD01011930.1:49-903(+)
MGGILSYFFPDSDQSDQSSPAPIEQLVEDKADRVTEELSAAREETEQAYNKEEDLEVSDLADEKEFEVVEEASELLALQSEEGFEVVQETRLDLVQNVINEGNGDLKENISVSMEASPEPLTVEMLGSIQDMEPEEEAIIDLVSTPFPEPINVPTPEPTTDMVRAATPEQIRSPTPEPTKSPAPEHNTALTPEPTKSQTPEPIPAPTLETTKDPAPECIQAPAPEPIRALTTEVIKDLSAQSASTTTTEITNESSPGPGPEVEVIGSVEDNNIEIEEVAQDSDE